MIPINRHRVSVERMIAEADTDKESWQSVTSLADTPCDVQPASSEDTVLVEGVYGETFSIYTTNSGIMKGDRLTVLNTTLSGTRMVVKGIDNWNSGFLPHYKMTATRMSE